jgi:methyltransferase (TIGR00027 family)
MREGRPSQTASLVAMARALAHDGFTTARGFSDPAAISLLSPGWKLVHRFAARGLRRANPDGRAKALAQIDVLPLRVLAIDAALADAVAAGCSQVVILGAGLDTRAYRLEALAGADLFEVDHPATQNPKRSRTTPLRPLTRSLTYVPVDFERDSLEVKLRASGFRTDRPTAWVWEGVVMYLTDAALRASLDSIGALSPPGSVLILHYHEPTPGRRKRRLLLAFWREPQIGLRTRDAVHAELRRARFEVVHDSVPAEWVERWGASPLAGETARITRLAVARKPRPPTGIRGSRPDTTGPVRGPAAPS